MKIDKPCQLRINFDKNNKRLTYIAKDVFIKNSEKLTSNESEKTIVIKNMTNMRLIGSGYDGSLSRFQMYGRGFYIPKFTNPKGEDAGDGISRDFLYSTSARNMQSGTLYGNVDVRSCLMYRIMLGAKHGAKHGVQLQIRFSDDNLIVT